MIVIIVLPVILTNIDLGSNLVSLKTLCNFSIIRIKENTQTIADNADDSGLSSKHPTETDKIEDSDDGSDC